MQLYFDSFMYLIDSISYLLEYINMIPKLAPFFVSSEILPPKMKEKRIYKMICCKVGYLEKYL